MQQKLGSGSNGILARRKLNGNLTLPTSTIRVVGILQMVFTNSIMITHVNRTVDQPPMSSMAIGGYRNVDSRNPKRGYG